MEVVSYTHLDVYKRQDEDYEITFPEEDFIQRIDVQGEISRSASYDFYYGDYGLSLIHI